MSQSQSQIEGLQKAVSALRGQRRDLIQYLRAFGTLADKARLIHLGIWKCPVFDDNFGLVKSAGWEEDYSPSRAVISREEGIEQWRHLPSSDAEDPENIKMAIQFWGLDAAIAEFKKYTFEGILLED